MSQSRNQALNSRGLQLGIRIKTLRNWNSFLIQEFVAKGTTKLTLISVIHIDWTVFRTSTCIREGSSYGPAILRGLHMRIVHNVYRWIYRHKQHNRLRHHQKWMTRLEKNCAHLVRAEN
ncbi:unnamed protein product [Cylicocyclus nassatus]|uniref:Uncharacterized protein n=1 Tax=Cylicocyclus nassatus TaxID=53992 RepID=A0AA36GQ83_CYLNA|nr:unnamed protein product [Cylicocyclus nassatus]